jgi:hypothetical protein
MGFRWANHGRACLQAGQRGARSHRKRELISPNGHKKKGKGRLADTHISFALQSHPFCKDSIRDIIDHPFLDPFCPLYPQIIRLQLLHWLEACPVESLAWC